MDRASLDTNSQGRIADNEDFLDIIRVSEAMGKRIRDTSQSLLLTDVVKEREDLQGMDIASHGNVSGPVEDEEKVSETEKDQDPAERLIESVLKDVYAKEAMAILLDLEKQQKEMASKSTK